MGFLLDSKEVVNVNEEVQIFTVPEDDIQEDKDVEDIDAILFNTNISLKWNMTQAGTRRIVLSSKRDALN